MTREQWEKVQHDVADAMLVHTRPFVSPLGTSTESVVRLVGTGSFIDWGGERILLTCEHVARKQPMEYRLNQSEDVLRHPDPWTTAPSPIDAAFARIADAGWQASNHGAVAIPRSRFAMAHRIVEQAELLFFRGFAGENARYAFEVHQTNGSGYCSQEKRNTGDTQCFEIFWEPENIQFTAGTSAEAKAEMKYEDARGFSGSLVWNTRYLEVTNQGGTWSPNDAVVTGLLRRWDQDTRTLLAWRVEHLRKWLDGKLTETGVVGTPKS